MKNVFLSFYLVVVIAALSLVYVSQPVFNLFYSKIYQETEAEKSRQLAKGVIYVLEQDLLRLPVDRWAERIKTLEPHFSYDIAIKDYAHLQLNEAQKNELRQRQIICVDECDYMYHQVGDSQMVLIKGPFSAFYKAHNPDTLPLLAVWWLAGLLFMALPTAIFMLFFWRKLRKISLSAGAFGNGDFDARTDIGKRSALAPIAVAFNNMADQIQGLINSHKALTNAVSHELRSPIARIRFGLEMQASSSTPEKKRRYTKGLMSDVRILEELVTELLTYASFDREKIFKPFTRLDDSRCRVTGGYGLGLAIVQRIVRWHSGSVAVADSPLGGVRFTIHWPGLVNQQGNRM